KEAGIEIDIAPTGRKDRYDFGHRNLEIRAKSSYNATDDQIKFVDSLILKKIIDPKKTPAALPHHVREEEVISSSGKIKKGYSPTADFLPEDLRDLCLSAGIKLEGFAIRFVELLRWIEKARGPVKIRDTNDHRIGLYWKTTQDKYYSVPWPKRGPINITGDGFEGFTWTDEDQKIFTNIWSNKDIQEPLGHQLLREARGISDHNLRSALLICYSALEVGIKQHISKCAPDAGWLAMYAPTPPLVKILKKYLPIIHGNKEDFKKWSEIKSELNIVAQFVEDRNRLAHQGEGITGSLKEYLRVTGDLLFAFDVFEGHSWAKDCVSKKFGNLLGWSAKRNSISLTIQIPE
ncbi:hypothetical protein E9G45_RS25550, partial [Escherichia coli]|nr:hypothetical protein [Escherichia coli]